VVEGAQEEVRPEFDQWDMAPRTTHTHLLDASIDASAWKGEEGAGHSAEHLNGINGDIFLA
jgi:hypothetical protein